MRQDFGLLIGAGMGLLVLSGAQAQDVKAKENTYSATYTKCMDKSGGVTVEMRDCINAEIDRQDKDLNDTYKKVMAKLAGADGDDQRNALQTAERAWIAYRAAECEFEASPEGDGTLGPVIQDGCFLDMTYERVQFLKKQL